MTELVPRRPLEGRETLVGDVRLVVRSDLTAYLLTMRDAVPIDGAIAMGPCEHLVVSTGGADPTESLTQLAAAGGGGTVLVQDMTAAFVLIDLIGPAIAAKLGIPRGDPGTATVTRLADLRIVVAHRDDGLRLVVGASHAPYAWSWLVAKLGLQ
ncbi:hypothetical protein [Sphingopyxis fribergensis]